MALAPTDVGNGGYDAGIRLVAAHRSGDPAAFDEIVRTHYPTLLTCARRRLRNPEDAQDAVQETLLRAYRGLDRFGRSGDWRLGAWLNTILLHVCTDIPARRRPTVPLDDWLADAHALELDEAIESPSDHVALAAVHQAIATLPDSQRRAFELRLVEGRTYEEVAGTLGITKTNARARVQRARTTLQHALKGAGAVSGTLAAFPLFLTTSARSAFRRVFSSAAGAASSQALSAGAATGSQTAAAMTSSPVGSGMQLIAQVSATPVAQAVVASATSIPKGSVVLGIVASLATAGGVGPALISGTTTAGRTTAPPAHVVSALQSPATTPSSAGVTSTAHSASSSTPTPAPTATSESPSSTSSPSAPAWVTLAAASTAYRQPAPSTPQASTTSASSGTSTSTSSGSGTGATTSSASTTAPSTSGSSTTSGATSTPATPPATHTFPLPVGTCSGVTGFPGVTAPTSLPPLSSSVLDAILSTGAVSLATNTGSPAFDGTALVKATVGSTAPVHVRVGTCLAEGGSLLAVDMTGTTGAEVQLVGSLVSAPLEVTPTTASSDVAYLFRGNVTQIAGTAGPGGGLPWGLPTSFVAEVQVQQPAKTGTLTVVFLQPMNQVGVNQVTPGTSTPPAGSTGGTTSGTEPTGGTGGTSSATTSSTGTTKESQPATSATPGSTSSSSAPAA